MALLLWAMLWAARPALGALPPVITVQPVDQTVQPGDTATFTVAATSGTALSYQWYFKGTQITGATNSTCLVTNAQATNAGAFFVTLQNAGGTVNSSNAVLTVSNPKAVAVDSLNSVATTNLATRTWSHTVSSGKNRLLVVGVALADVGDSISSVTYGGTALTRLAFIQAGNTAELWYLLAPSAGTANVVVTWTGTRDMAGWSGSFTNVHQTAPIGNYGVSNNTTTTPSLTLAAATNDLVVDMLSANGDSVSVNPGAGQTQVCNKTTGTGGSDCRGLASVEAGAANVTMSWTLGAAKAWGLAAMVLKAALPIQADVRATLTGPASVIAGANFTCTLAVTNAGPANATNIVITNILPAGATFFSASGGGSSNNGAVTWPAFNLPSGAGTNFTLTLTAPARGSLTNTVQSTASTYDPDGSNNNGSATNAVVVTTVTPFDASLAESSCAKVADANTLTWSQTVNNGNNRMLIVGIGLRQKASIVSSVTYAGLALTNLVYSRVKNGVEIWGLVAPPVGTANIVVNWSGTSDMVGWSGAFTNVDQSIPVGDTGGAGATTTTPSVTVNAASGDLVVDTVSTKGDALSLTPSVGQTEICDDGISTAGADGRGASSYEAGVGSVTMSWTMSASKDWEIAAVVVKAIPVPKQADVAVSVTGPFSVFAASNLIFTVSVTNLGPFTATNVVVSDTLPAGVTFVSASGGGAHSNGVVRWTIPILPYTATTNFTITITSPLNGTLTNTVASTATTSDLSASNNDGTSAAATVVTTVINLPPVANNDSYSVLEDTVLTVPASGVLTNDTDPEGQPLAAVLVAGATHGTLTLNSNGSFTYTPAANYNGPDAFTYRAYDGTTNSATAMVSLTVTPVNDAPTITSTNIAGWAYRKQITIDHTKVGGGADLANFPVLIRLGSDANLAASAQASGNDLLFTSADGLTKLSHEIETYTPASGALVAWVKIPLLSATVDTVINLYYGNASATNQQNATNVWDTNFKGVWHLNQGTGVTAVDSTSNANSAVPTDANPTASTGEIGDALTFAYPAQLIIGASASLDLTIYNNWTMSAWVKPTSYAGTSWPIIYSYGIYRASLGLTVSEGTDGLIENWINNTALRQSTAAATLNAWNYVTISRTATTTSFYLNGVAAGSANVTTVTPANQPSYIGNDGEGAQDQFQGLIDEVRVSASSTSSGARSASWIATEYNNQSSPGTFSSLGAQQAVTIVITLAGTNEDTPSSGTTVSTILTNANWADADAGALKGLAITAKTGNGTWQYSTDSATWTAFGAVSASNGLLLNSTTQVRYLPDSQNGETATFSLRAWDQTTGTAAANSTPAYANPGTGGGSTAYSSQTGTVSMAITSVNDAPVANAQAVSTPEDTAKAITLTGSDVENNPLTFSIVSGPTNGVLSGLNTNSGAVTYTPNVNFNGADTFTYRANDGTNNSATATVSITVTPVNDAPSLFSSYSLSSITEDDTNSPGTLVANIMAGGVSDPDAGALQGSAVVGVNNTNGTWQYTLNGTNWFAIGNASLSAARLLPADAKTAVRFVPNTDWNGVVFPFSYKAWDQTTGIAGGIGDATTSGGSTAFSPTTSSTSVTVISVNDAPVRTAGTVNNLTVLEDSGNTSLGLGTLVYGPGGGADESGQTLTCRVTFVPTATLGRIVLADAVTVVTANTTYSLAQLQGMKFQTATNASGGPSTFAWTVQDNGGGADTLTESLTITVTPVNDAPAASAQSVSTTEDTAKAITLTGSDVENSPLTFSIVTGPTNGSLSGLNTNNGTVTYTPATNFSGADSFSFLVHDGTTNSATATVSITVTPVNDAPVANAPSVSTAEDTAKEVTLTGSDVDNDALTFSIVTGPTNGVLSGLNATNGTVTYTPNTNFNGGDSFTFRVSDGPTNSVAATVSLTVTPVNDPPVATNQVLTTDENTPKSITVTGSDFDSTNLTWAILVGPTNGTISGLNTNTGLLLYTPATNYNGPDFFTFTASDGSLLATGTVSLTVTPVNDPPVAVNQSVTTAEDTPVSITVSGTDVDSSSLAYAILTSPDQGTFSGLNPITGTLLYKPATNFHGADVFTFLVNDGSLLATGTVSITVTPVNDLPVANAQSVSTPEDMAKVIALTASDADDDPLLFTIVSGPTNGFLSGFNTNNGTLTYTPNTNFNGTDSFTFHVNDGTANSTEATVSITVTPVNDSPVADAQSIGTTAAAARVITLTGSDADNDPLTFSIVNGPTNGSMSGLNATNGTVTYTPNTNFNGTDSFAFRVNDGTTNSAAATVSITVTPVADIATTVMGPATVVAGGNFSYTVTLTNLGVSAASGVMVSNLLPANTVFVSASAGGLHNAGLVTWPALSILPNGAATNFTVTVTAPASGTLTNTVFSAAATSDPDSSNNDGTAVAASVVTTVYVSPVLTLQLLPSGTIQLEFTTLPNTTCLIQTSSNLINWMTVLTTNSASGCVNFIDQDATDYSRRFYRSRQGQ